MAAADDRADCNADCNELQELGKNAPGLSGDDIAAAVESLNGRPELNALVTGAHSEAQREALALTTDAIESQVRVDVGAESATLLRL